MLVDTKVTKGHMLYLVLDLVCWFLSDVDSGCTDKSGSRQTARTQRIHSNVQLLHLLQSEFGVAASVISMIMIQPHLQ